MTPTEQANLDRTHQLLVELNARQETLHVRLDATGLTDFADRADWLHAHRTPDEQLAWSRHWARLERKYTPSLAVPHVRPAPVVFASLSVPKRKPRPVIEPDAALKVALKVLNAHPERQANWWRSRVKEPA